MQADDVSTVRGAEVWCADGTSLGRVSAVHVRRDTGEPMLLQIIGDEPEAQAIVPATDAANGRAGLLVPYDRAAVEQGPVVGPHATLSVGEVAYVFAYYGAGTVRSNGPLTERATGVGDAEAPQPGVRPLPPIVVIRPGLSGGRPESDRA